MGTVEVGTKATLEEQPAKFDGIIWANVEEIGYGE